MVGLDFKKNSLSTNEVDEGIHKTKILTLGKKNYIMAESRKIGIEAKYVFSDFTKIHGLITEVEPPKDILKAAKDLNVEIILPS